jgi:hypothetical protein
MGTKISLLSLDPDIPSTRTVLPSHRSPYLHHQRTADLPFLSPPAPATSHIPLSLDASHRSTLSLSPAILHFLSLQAPLCPLRPILSLVSLSLARICRWWRHIKKILWQQKERGRNKEIPPLVGGSQRGDDESVVDVELSILRIRGGGLALPAGLRI